MNDPKKTLKHVNLDGVAAAKQPKLAPMSAINSKAAAGVWFGSVAAYQAFFI